MSRLGHYEVHFWCSKLELKLLITKYYQQHFYPNCMSQLPTIIHPFQHNLNLACTERVQMGAST